VKTRDWNPAILLGIVLGASLGGIIAVILIRRSEDRPSVGLKEIPWRDVVTLSAPTITLTRRLLQMSRREPG